VRASGHSAGTKQLEPYAACALKSSSFVNGRCHCWQMFSNAWKQQSVLTVVLIRYVSFRSELRRVNAFTGRL
jgi:hypothetical protein